MAQRVALNVAVADRISSGLVALLLQEAAAIWNHAGFVLEWRLAGAMPSSDFTARATIHVTDDSGPDQIYGAAIGWVPFRAPTVPGDDLLSHGATVYE
jgi:hypothetical protein